MWSAPTARLWIVGVASLASFAIGFAAAWSWQGSRGEAKLTALKLDYSTLAAQAIEAARIEQEALQEATRRQEARYEQTIHRIQQEADSRPARIVRIRVCDDVPAGGSSGDPARDPAVTAGPAADGSGVGSPAGDRYRAVDLSGLDRVIDEAKRVSARLSALQGVCG